jgi:hypothetical protein
LGLFLFLFLHKKAQNGEATQKPKRHRAFLKQQKELRNGRIELVIFLSLLTIFYSVGLVKGVKEISDCTYDLKHENFVRYSGELDVIYELSLGKGSHRTNYKIVFEDKGKKVVIYLDPTKYGLTEGSYDDISLIYSGRSQILLDILKDNG